MMRTRINGRMHLTVMMKKLKRVQSLEKAKVKERIKRYGMKAKNLYRKEKSLYMIAQLMKCYIELRLNGLAYQLITFWEIELTRAILIGSQDSCTSLIHNSHFKINMDYWNTSKINIHIQYTYVQVARLKRRMIIRYMQWNGAICRRP